jgi:pimeloyl-ACP methyl ester carboxylesterase
MVSFNKLTIIFFAFVFFPACIGNKGNTHQHTQKAKNFSIFKTRKKEQTYLKAYNKTLALWPVPYEEVDIKTSFGIAHVIISGPKEAAPLVLLHGLNASSTMWYPNVGAFSEKYRVYAIDFILEPGKSISEGEIKDRDEVVKWYNEIFDHFKFEKISIVGASRGGWIATNLAIHSKHRISKIILLSPAQTITNIHMKGKIFVNIDFILHPRRGRLRNVLQTLSYNVDNLKQAWINQFYLASKIAKRNKGIVQMTPFSDEELQALNIPVLLLIGDQDIINNEKTIEKAKRLLSNVDAGIIKNAGHFLSFDQAEIVNKRVMDFLSRKE